MADTITIGANVIQIIPAAGGMSNFDITTYFPNGIRCSGWNFVGADTDVLKIRDKVAAGSFLEPSLSGNSSREFGNPLDCFPYILATDQTQGTPANCIITLYYI